MAGNRLMLDYILDHEEKLRDRVYMTQPVGNDQVVDYTWGQVVDQSRRMAAHLQSRGYPRGARIAILSKNCAHFIMAEVAIWMAGYTTVAIFPTETAETINYVLTHSEASLLFVGKLDLWDHQKRGVPAGLPCIAFPLAPKTEFDTWDAIVARTPPLAGRPTRAKDDLAMLIYTSGSTGTPKGVMITLEAFTRASEGIAADMRTARRRPRQPHAVVPAARAQLRAGLGRGLVAGRRRNAPVLRRVARHLPAGPAAHAADAVPLGAAPVAQVPAGRVREDAAGQARPPARHPDPRQDRREEGAQRASGLDQVKLAGSGSAPIPPDLIAVVPQASACRCTKAMA